MKLKTVHLYILIFILNSIIALIAFAPFFHHPGSILLSQWDDGLKNIFTLFTYVKEPVTADGIMKYNSFCYPFGDYVFYTDNTPIFSVPFRWFCHHITDLSAYTIIIFQLLVIANIVVSGLLVFYIFRRILKENTFSFILAIVLPWTNVQVLRILRGHFNLSFTSLILLAFCLLLAWDKYKAQWQKQALVLAGMIVLTVAAFLAHPYYLPIITIFIAAALFIYGILCRKQPYGKTALISSVIYAAVAGGISVLILYANDKYLALRSVKANGYDWMEQKTRFTYLFSHYYFEKVYLPVPGLAPDEVDKPGYLGNIGFISLLSLIILAIVNKNIRAKIMTVQKTFFKDPIKTALLFGSLIMLMISFGEVYYTATNHADGIKLVNVLNPFFYIHFITNRVEQFRFLERFMWPFYYGFYIWVMFTLAGLYRSAGQNTRKGIITAVLLLGGTEVFFFVKEINRQMVMENVLNRDYVKRFVPKNLDASQFQAILPIPYYFTGAEDSIYDYNIDGDPDWVSVTYSLCAATQLPLMSSSMSRTPRIFPVMLMGFVANDTLDGRLASRLNDKPILVAVNKTLVNNPTARGVPVNKLDAALYWKANQFTTRNHLQPFDSIDNIVFYKWYPHGASQ